MIEGGAPRVSAAVLCGAESGSGESSLAGGAYPAELADSVVEAQGAAGREFEVRDDFGAGHGRAGAAGDAGEVLRGERHRGDGQGEGGRCVLWRRRMAGRASRCRMASVDVSAFSLRWGWSLRCFRGSISGISFVGRG